MMQARMSNNFTTTVLRVISGAK